LLPLTHKIIFLVYALAAGLLGTWGFYRLYLRVRRGRPDPEARADHPVRRLVYALRASLTQERTFRKRRALSVFHAFIFYGFVYYLLVNVIDGLEGYVHFDITSTNPLGAAYNFLADMLSLLVLVGVIAFVIRRYLAPARRDFRFNEKTLLHERIKRGYINRDSALVSAFITFHVGSRILGQGAKLAQNGTDPYQPVASLVSNLFTPANAEAWRVFGYWGALGSILAFLAYFPYTKHIHIFMAPVNYFFHRNRVTGELPPMKVDLEAEQPEMGAHKLEDLTWPRLLDAYACIQCNRCQDVCPASGTGKALSPAALEINKRMELNVIAAHPSPFALKPAPYETGAPTARPLLEYAISPEAVWACTTCGACMEVCPTQNEQMLDIIDIRRHQVMVEGEFPPQLQTAFRGMERAKNPWGISHDKRMEWAEGLRVPTIEENPTPDVLYWVGCAASYDPGAQKVSRSFVQLLDRAGVNYAVLGKREACTGDSARRAGNEYLYLQLAEQNVETLNEVRPKLIIATCPHCMNMIGNEYKQLGGDYHVMHHTQYLEMLVAEGRLQPDREAQSVTYHDPCYLGRHNGVYDAPREVIRAMGLEILELERSREKSFCCGAGGAQFWKEEEEGHERISDNRFKEIQQRLDAAKEGKVVAVGCPFCKSMLNSTPAKGESDVVVKDVAELLLDSVQRAGGERPTDDASPVPPAPEATEAPIIALTPQENLQPEPQRDAPPIGQSAYTNPGTTTAEVEHAHAAGEEPGERTTPAVDASQRKKWTPKGATTDDVSSTPPQAADRASTETGGATRAKWTPKGGTPAPDTPVPVTPAPDAPASSTPTPADADPPAAAERRKWSPKSATTADAASTVGDAPATPTGSTERKKWTPQATSEPEATPSLPDSGSAHAEAARTPSESTDRKKWQPRSPAKQPTEPSGPERHSVALTPDPTTEPVEPATSSAPASGGPVARPKWTPKARAETGSPAAAPFTPAASDGAPEVTPAASTPSGDETLPDTNGTPSRKKWVPKKND